MCVTLNNMNLFEMTPEVLEGDSVELSFLELKDSEELLFLVNSSREHLSRWFPWVESFLALEDASASIDAYQMQREMANGGAFGIRRLEDGALMGEVILQWVDRKNLSGSIGYFLGEEFIGNGYAREAVQLVVDYAFRKLGLHRLEISAAEENAPSIALALALGFQKEGFFRDFEFLHGKFLSHCRFSLLSGDDRLRM